jgi:hypothetical protein
MVMNSAFKRAYTVVLVCSLSLVSSAVIGMEVAKTSPQSLLGKEFDDNGIPVIFHIIQHGKTDRVEWYIQQGVNLNVSAPMMGKNGKIKEVTPYEYARFNQKKDIAQLLRKVSENQN